MQNSNLQPPHNPIKTKDYLSLLDQVPAHTPITVIHMLRFNSTTMYPPDSPFNNLPPVSGRSAFYDRYVPAGNAAAREAGIAPAETRMYSSFVMNLLAGRDGEGSDGNYGERQWDVVTARRYASFEDYARYQASGAYQELARPHRDAALRDWSLVCCVEEEPPPIRS